MKTKENGFFLLSEIPSLNQWFSICLLQSDSTQGPAVDMNMSLKNEELVLTPCFQTPSPTSLQILSWNTVETGSSAVNLLKLTGAFTGISCLVSTLLLVFLASYYLHIFIAYTVDYKVTPLLTIILLYSFMTPLLRYFWNYYLVIAEL